MIKGALMIALITFVPFFLVVGLVYEWYRKRRLLEGWHETGRIRAKIVNETVYLYRTAYKVDRLMHEREYKHSDGRTMWLAS